MAIIPRGNTRISALDLDMDSARAFTSEAFSAAWDGAGGVGERTGSTARSFRMPSFSIITVSAAGELEWARHGRTIPPIGWGSPIRIVRSAAATADFRQHAAGPVPGDLAHKHMRRRTIRRPGPMRRKPAVGTISARRAAAADTARVRRTVAITAATTAETAPRPVPVIAPAHHTAAAAHTARVRPMDAAMGETAPCPAIARARHTADTAPVLLIVEVDRLVPAAVLTAVEVVAPIVVVAVPTVAVPMVAAAVANQTYLRNSTYHGAGDWFSLSN